MTGILLLALIGWPGGRVVGVFDPTDPASWLQAGGVVVAVMVVLWLFTTGKVVPGSQYEAAIKERDEYKVENARIHDHLEGEVFDTLKATAIALATANDLVRGTLSRERGRGSNGGG